MTFRVAARTILHLGQELITSDAIALYELIKNAYDAGSPNVRISVELVLDRVTQRNLIQKIEDLLEAMPLQQEDPETIVDQELGRLKNTFADGLIETAPTFSFLKEKVKSVMSLSELYEIVMDCNKVTLTDTGKGMTLSDLEDAFLTIGTRSKLNVGRRKQGQRVLLGEKGIGRLSSMRIGSRLYVETSTEGDDCWNKLFIDWSVFDHASDTMLEDIPVAPKKGRSKEAAEKSGTRIAMTGLRRNWSKKYVTDIANNEISRLNDPFQQRKRFPIVLTHNKDVIPIPMIPKWLLRAAHANFEGSLRILDNKKLLCTGTMTYGNMEDTFSLNEEQLLGITGISDIEVLNDVGPFKVEVFWYNRPLLTALEGEGDRSAVLKEQERWAGGLMLFRDGFRVLPYGSPNDDWLDIDRKALASGGYKINRRQLIGRVLISKEDNPNLVDQANREGLVDNEAKEFLQATLSHLVQTEFRHFMNKVNKVREQLREPVPQKVLAERLKSKKAILEQNLETLVERVPEVRRERKTLASIRKGIKEVSEILDEVEVLARTYQEGRTNLLNLAGVGLTVEILAHELNQATSHALGTLRSIEPEISGRVGKVLTNLDAQLKTLQKRLSVLDPLSVSGRNRKETFNLVQLISDTISSHEEQFSREGIEVRFKMEPHQTKSFRITAVKGMIIQVLENLISNSVFWLSQRKKLSPESHSKITITLDSSSGVLTFSDNGFGIPRERKDDIFEAFFTTRPSGQGKGLGLFIAREIAKYHGANLTLADDGSKKLRTFVLDLGEMA